MKKVVASKAHNDIFGAVIPANNNDNVTVDSEQSNTGSKKLEKVISQIVQMAQRELFSQLDLEKSTSIEESVFYCQSHLFCSICKKMGQRGCLI